MMGRNALADFTSLPERGARLFFTRAAGGATISL